MSIINILDSSVYNQISAGEVVANPASVVKELVENSIDAGADKITVQLEKGGIKSITVTDNGCGMAKEDLPKAIMSHATSKISTAKDLLTIGTLGFRGEALASIAAVSEVIIKSKFSQAAIAYSLTVKGGEVISISETNLSHGTGISVNNLFYNTPARYKFLKSEKGEESEVTKLIQELIFANPNVSFLYYIDGKICFQTEGGGLESAAYAVFPPPVSENLIPISGSEQGNTVTGMTARPASSGIGANRSRQIFIVNGRVISDATISAVIQSAYGESLMKRTFPAVVVDIVMPFELVDVNVHPNKKEVRFAKPKLLNALIYRAVKDALEKDAENRQKSIFEGIFPHGESKSNTTISIQELNTVKETPIINPYTVPVTRYRHEVAATETLPESRLTFRDSFIHEKAFPDPKPKITFKTIGHLFDTYILVESENSFLIIDQHAAHERFLYDRLLADNSANITVQELLFPYTVEVDGEYLADVADKLPELRKLGFDLNLKGSTLKLTAIPFILINLDADTFMKELAQECRYISKLSDMDSVREKLARMACKKAIKAGDRLNNEQIEYVLKHLNENGMPLQCPHGRPTVVKITRTEIEKLFRRIV